MPFSKNLYDIETSQFICNANQLTSFYNIGVLSENNFETLALLIILNQCEQSPE